LRLTNKQTLLNLRRSIFGDA